MVDHSAAQEKLLSARARLVHQMSELGANESGELRHDLDFSEGFADAAATTAERTEVLGIVDSLKTRLDKVDASLARIEDGTYGICSRCANRIPPERMEALPISRLCVRCKSSRT